MKELIFKLTTNEEEIVNIKTNYFMKDNVLNFTIDNNIYRYNVDNHILNKENDESIMNIDMDNNHIIYLYKALNKEFKLPTSNNNLSINDNNIKYIYEIEDNNIVNIIEISY